MVKPSRARMRSAVLLGSLLALLPALPARRRPHAGRGPQLRAGSLMLIPAPAMCSLAGAAASPCAPIPCCRPKARPHSASPASSPTCWRAVAARACWPKAAARTGGIRFQIVPTFRDSGEGYAGKHRTGRSGTGRQRNRPVLRRNHPRPARHRRQQRRAASGADPGRATLQLARFHLDSARHFQSLDEIKRVLDAMAAHKLNTFHWHLTDDQGWRMEIKRYPKLTGVGSCRRPATVAPIRALASIRIAASTRRTRSAK